ncbi:putative beta-lactamase [Glonium stellatum]|uniref:Putative beta-lactamase n=1 Tax=Glonium stellatum TaxID=574774 RepID=A0A8E2JRL1_9PEZI|nr:putative beta-lactamase [Glonium stellatum]
MKFSLSSVAIFSLASFVAITNSQSTQNCPLLGPIFPAPLNPALSKAVHSAKRNFPQILTEALSASILDNSTTSFSINVFSASDNQTLFTYHYAAPALSGSLPGGSLNDNTIYRIGSLSKLFTAYTLLVKAGNLNWNDPVTKYVPELANASTANPIANSQWSDITVGALASHMAGVTRDYSLFDLSTQDYPFAALGLPTLNTSEIPPCGFGPGLTSCSRQQYLKGVLSRHPVTAPFNTPIYSNAGYAILGYVIETVTGKDFSEAITSGIYQPLNLSRSSLLAPPTNDTNIIIPGDATSNAFYLDGSAEIPAGGMYSTASDIRTLGLSILHSSLLPPALTRRWMKPMSHTSNVLNAVGAPWEIARMQLPLSPYTNDTRMVDIYTKSGDLTVYSSLLGLVPDHNIGFSVLTAGKSSGLQRYTLASLISETWVPALESAAREEATARFAGTYSSDGTNNSTVTIELEDNRPGLDVTRWISDGIDFRSTLKLLLDNTTDPSVNMSIRLYPTSLTAGNSTSFRAVFETLPYEPIQTKGVFASNCETWVSVDGFTYGSIGLDDFEFVLDGTLGKAVELKPRVLRTNLLRRA